MTDRAALAEFALDPNVVYLNHGAFGALPRAVIAERARLAASVEANPQRFYTRERAAQIVDARAAAATALDVEATSCALVRNVSEVVSATLASLELRTGEEILLAGAGYGAVRLAAETWARRTGAVVVTAAFPVGADDENIVAAYVEALTPRTRLVVVDQITSPTATVLPVADICRAVRSAAEATVLVDAAHVPGTLPTDVEQLGADLWVANLHKWMFTPRGCALLWAAESWRERIRPLVLSWTQDEPFPANLELPGTVDDVGWLTIPAGVRYWAQIGGWDQTVRNSLLVATGQRIVADALGTLDAAMPAVPAPTMRLVALPGGLVADAEAALRLTEVLSDEYAIEVPITFTGGQAYARIAGQVYNSVEDYTALAGALQAELADGRGAERTFRPTPQRPV